MNRLNNYVNPEKASKGLVCTTPTEFALERGTEPVIIKHTFDGFLHTKLELTLRKMHITHVICAGMVTTCCVLFTAASASAFLRGFKVTLIKDCCADRTVKKHNSIFDVHV